METCCTWLMVSYFVIKICHVVLSLCCCFFYEKKKKLENNHEYVQIQDGMVWNADCERWKLDGNYIVEKRQCVVLFPFFLPSSVAHRLLLSWSPIPHCNFSLTLLAVLKLNRMCMTAWHVYVFYLAYIHVWKQQNNTAHGICLMKSEQMTITFNFYLFAFSFFWGCDIITSMRCLSVPWCAWVLFIWIKIQCPFQKFLLLRALTWNEKC